jgi:hypothetical protein
MVETFTTQGNKLPKKIRELYFQDIDPNLRDEQVSCLCEAVARFVTWCHTNNAVLWGKVHATIVVHERYVANNPDFPPNLIYLGKGGTFDPSLWLEPGEEGNTFTGWLKPSYSGSRWRTSSNMSATDTSYSYAAPMNQSTHQKVLREIVNPFSNW